MGISKYDMFLFEKTNKLNPFQENSFTIYREGIKLIVSHAPSNRGASIHSINYRKGILVLYDFAYYKSAKYRTYEFQAFLEKYNLKTCKMRNPNTIYTYTFKPQEDNPCPGIVITDGQLNTRAVKPPDNHQSIIVEVTKSTYVIYNSIVYTERNPTTLIIDLQHHTYDLNNLSDRIDPSLAVTNA